jgi:hypothetical protein
MPVPTERQLERFIEKVSAWRDAGERIARLLDGKRNPEDAYRALRLRAKELNAIREGRMTAVEWQEFGMVLNLITDLERILPDEVYERLLQELRR